TAFLYAPLDSPRPSFTLDYKIPVDGGSEYSFSGYFSGHRAGGIIILSYYDEKHLKISEQSLKVLSSPQYSGGNSLDNYEFIQHTFVPVTGAKYIQLKIIMDEQTDLSQPNAYLFFTKVCLGLVVEEESSFFPQSSGSECLIRKIQEEKWLSFGMAKLPVIEKAGALSVEYQGCTHQLDLKHELELIAFMQKGSIQHSKQEIKALLKVEGLEKIVLIDELDFDELKKLNKDYGFGSLYKLVQAVVIQTSQTIRLFSSAQENSLFYVELGVEREKQKKKEIAQNCYRIALHFYPNAQAHEHLGNLALTGAHYLLASSHYQQAIILDTQSYWVYTNLSQSLMHEGKEKQAVDVLLEGGLVFPGLKFLQDKLTEIQNIYWHKQSGYLTFLASIDDRVGLLVAIKELTENNALTYRKSFLRLSEHPVTPKTKFNKILIIAETSLPQCLRYRIKQKIEQLELAGFESKYISWSNTNQALQEIPWYDSIIFYRVPALPDVIQLIEYARSLGIPTFYEIDDLIFEPVYPPDINSYAGKVDSTQYYDLLKGMALNHCAAQLCDYALASTQPLLDKLIPLVKTKQGFLHRNGLDSNNVFNLKAMTTQQEQITLFYGSGTLAHNSDFIVEVLPALEKILGEFKVVRLVIAGFLQLPDDFNRKYKQQIVMLPFTKNLQVYNNYIQGADINMAVLKQDEINDCKSELKWFEAACFGIPSVVSQTQNYQDVIRHGEDGFIVNSVDSWYKTLKQLITQADLRQQVGEAAYQRVRKEYSLSTMANNLKSIFSQLNKSLL
ncbi:MAG: glycosyltransferase, partial [Methyloprofundus sp.]|nr:glycosyltransferase [Methyloprofundus sp.]